MRKADGEFFLWRSQKKNFGKPFLALKAFCCLRGEPRTFNVEKILEIKEVDTAIDTGKAN